MSDMRKQVRDVLASAGLVWLSSPTQERQLDQERAARAKAEARLLWLESDEAVERAARTLIAADGGSVKPTRYYLDVAGAVRDALLEGEPVAELRSRGRT